MANRPLSPRHALPPPVAGRHAPFKTPPCVPTPSATSGVSGRLPAAAAALELSMAGATPSYWNHAPEALNRILLQQHAPPTHVDDNRVIRPINNDPLFIKINKEKSSLGRCFFGGPDAHPHDTIRAVLFPFSKY